MGGVKAGGVGRPGDVTEGEPAVKEGRPAGAGEPGAVSGEGEGVRWFGFLNQCERFSSDPPPLMVTLTPCFVALPSAASIRVVPEVNELILKQKQMSEEKRLKLDHPVSTAHSRHRRWR